MAKPDFGTGLNSSNSLYANLGLCFPFNDGSGSPKDAVSGTTISVFGTCTWGTDGTYGGWFQSDGSTGYATGTFAAINYEGNSDFTLAILFSDVANDTQYGRIIEKGSNTDWVLNVNQASNDNKVTFAVQAQGTPPKTSAVVCDGTFHVVHATYEIATETQTVYSDGGNPVVVTGIASSTSNAPFYLFRYGGGGLFTQTKLAGVWVWQQRVLNSTEVASHYSDLWQMFGASSGSRITRVICSGGD